MDTLTKEERHKNMSAIKSRDTKPEIYFRRQLFSLGIRYRICTTSIEGHPDLWLKKYRTAIFINGCFWHAHEGCRYFRIPDTNMDYWNKKFARNRKRDEIVRKRLNEQGLRVIVIWECAVRKMKSDSVFGDAVMDSVFSFLKSADSIFLEIDTHFICKN